MGIAVVAETMFAKKVSSHHLFRSPAKWAAFREMYCAGEGDCDSDTDCEGDLKCGKDNCRG